MKINDKEKRLLDKFMDWYKGEVKYNYEKLVGFIIGTLDNLDRCNFNNTIGSFVKDELLQKDIYEFVDCDEDNCPDEIIWEELKKEVLANYSHFADYLLEEYEDIMQEIRDDFVSEYSN